MKTAKSRLIVSIMTLAIAVVMATTVTYAWFAMSTTPTVEKFDLDVTSQEGIEVKVGDGLWKYNLKNTDLPTRAGLKMDAVTPMGTYSGDAFSYADTFAIGELSTNTLGAATQKDGKDKFYSFTIDFRSTTQWDIALDFANTAVTDDATVNTTAIKSPYAYTSEEAGSVIAQGGDLIAHSNNAVRIGLVSGASKYVYDMNSAAGFTGTKNVAQDYYEYITGSTLTNIQKVQGTTISTSTASDAAKIRLTADGDYFTASITVYVWLEGKDADCFASIYDDAFSVALAFKGIAIA